MAELKITACEDALARPFVDKMLCAEALVTSRHPVHIHGAWRYFKGNAILAVYGDAVAARYLCLRWLEAKLTKGQWDSIRQTVLSNETLGKIGQRHGLDDCVIATPGTPKVSLGTMATTVKAILGAVHRDGGDEALAQVMATLGLTHELLESGEL